MKIEVSSENHPRRVVIATLAHEMVHQYQNQFGLVMNHGDAFIGFKQAIFDNTGLEI